jgi:hypothetical protein
LLQGGFLSGPSNLPLNKWSCRRLPPRQDWLRPPPIRHLWLPRRQRWDLRARWRRLEKMLRHNRRRHIKVDLARRQQLNWQNNRQLRGFFWRLRGGSMRQRLH